MNRYSLSIPAIIFAFSLSAPHDAFAQTFKVEKYSIGGDGGTDYLTAEPGTGRVFVSRGTHVMVIDGATGKVLGDIPDTPRNHGIALAPKSNHGFITNGGDSTVTMFDLKTLAVIKKIHVPSGGLDGIMYDDFSNRRDSHESQPPDRDRDGNRSRDGRHPGRWLSSRTTPRKVQRAMAKAGSSSTTRARTRCR